MYSKMARQGMIVVLLVVACGAIAKVRGRGVASESLSTRATTDKEEFQKLRARFQRAAQQPVTIDSFKRLSAMSLDFADRANDPRLVLNAEGLAFKLARYVDDPSAHAVQQQIIERLMRRKLDTSSSKELWRTVFGFVFENLEPGYGHTGWTRIESDRFSGYLRRLSEYASSTKVRAVAALTQVRNRMVVDRSLGGLTSKERAEVLATARVAIQRLGDTKLNIDNTETLAEALVRPMREIETLYVGAEAPEIEGVDLKLQPMKLSGFRGKIVVLGFWASWCADCLVEVPAKRALIQKFAGQPVVFVGGNGDTNTGDALRAARKYKIDWPSFWTRWTGPNGNKTPTQEVWNVTMWPSVYVIGPKGVIRYKYAGDTKFAELEQAIRKLLPGS
jgi:thiol-disulfide isomerase/thioredoxin